MPKFGIILYLVSNLTPCIAFTKFNTKFGIALENAFYAKIPNFSLVLHWRYSNAIVLNDVLNFEFSHLKYYVKYNIALQMEF